MAYGRGAGGAPLDAHSVFEIGSVTKAFTATALAGMAADGLVRLDQPVAELLPQGSAVPSRDGRPIRLVALATQASGLPRLPDNLAPRDPADPYADYDGARLLAFLARSQLPRAPGAAYEYSNLGAGLLGPALRARLAPGHDASGAEVKGWTFDALAGAGALRSTAADLARFAVANLAAHRDAPRAPRARASGPAAAPPLAQALAATQTRRAETGVPNLGVGLAWHIATPPAGPAAGDTLVWHNGQTGGYAGFVGFSPARGVGVVVLSNSTPRVPSRRVGRGDRTGARAERPPPAGAQAHRPARAGRSGCTRRRTALTGRWRPSAADTRTRAPTVHDDRGRHILVGDARVSAAEQSRALQQDALITTARNTMHDDTTPALPAPNAPSPTPPRPATAPAATARLVAAMYTAFNARDLDAGLALLHPDVDWENGWEGGRLRGHAALRDYWTRQWAVIDPHVEPVGVAEGPDGRIVVAVRQTVRDRAGHVLDARDVRHAYRLEGGQVARMDILGPGASAATPPHPPR